MKSDQKRKNKAYYSILGVIFASFFIVFMILSLILPDAEISLREKRLLASAPALSPNRILDGSFADDFEKYGSDQIPFRDMWTDMKISADTLAGKNESQGVYRCSDGYLIEKMQEPDPALLEQNMGMVRHLGSLLNVPQTFVMVPNAVSVYSNKLPAFAVTADQQAFSAKASALLSGSQTAYLDLTDLLGSKAGESERLYYRTDHHWTTYAAMLCAPAVLESLGASLEEGWMRLPVCDTFTGSLSAKSGFSAMPDEIDIYVPENESTYLVTGSSGKRASVYSAEGLSGSDPYTVFLGGNEGYLHIETDNIGAGRVLVFKDSYFNCFLPYMLESFEGIDVIDPRYYSDDLLTLLYQNQYDRVLYFYDMNTFSEDTSLALVLGELPEEL